MGREYVKRAPAARDWQQTILDLRWKLKLSDAELAKRIGIPYSTLLNLKHSAVLQPLHATGERIMDVYRVTFEDEK